MKFLVIALAMLAYVPTVAAQTTDDIANVVFKEIEKHVIKDFFGKKSGKVKAKDEEWDKDKKKKKKHKKKKKSKSKKGKSKGLPAGLAKKNALPPGLAKQLERKGTLPPGLAKRSLPYALKSKLPPPPPGKERVIVGNDIVLIEKATGVILDILSDVVIPR